MANRKTSKNQILVIPFDRPLQHPRPAGPLPAITQGELGTIVTLRRVMRKNRRYYYELITQTREKLVRKAVIEDGSHHCGFERSEPPGGEFKRLRID